MFIKIFQVILDKDYRNTVFDSLAVARAKDIKAPRRSLYQKVFEGELPGYIRNLDLIFFTFNSIATVKKFTSQGYCGWPMSVSDVIEVVDSGNTDVPPGFYYVDPWGFPKVDF
ncbi:MAG: YodL domain-containing protein [Ruminococcus sp.]